MDPRAHGPRHPIGEQASPLSGRRTRTRTARKAAVLVHAARRGISESGELPRGAHGEDQGAQPDHRRRCVNSNLHAVAHVSVSYHLRTATRPFAVSTRLGVIAQVLSALPCRRCGSPGGLHASADVGNDDMGRSAVWAGRPISPGVGRSGPPWVDQARRRSIRPGPRHAPPGRSSAELAGLQFGLLEQLDTDG